MRNGFGVLSERDLVKMVTKDDLFRRVEIGVRDIEGHTIVGPLYPVR